jgi:ABC-type sugar transport system substrate-binding protein
MSRVRRAAGAVLVVALIAGVTACGSGEDSSSDGGSAKADASSKSSSKKVCFLFQDVETEFWAAGIKLITDEIQQKGWSVQQLNSQADANKQLQQLRDCISQKVDGIIIIPHDGESVINMVALANRADIPIGVFNRPPADNNPNKDIQVVADNAKIAEATVTYLADEARKQFDKTHKKIKPLIMVGDLGDSNAVNRKKGFDAVIAKNPDLFTKPVEVATKWDAETGRANLQSAMQANSDVGMLFTSSDFLWPQIRAVLQPLGKWKKIGEPGHIPMAGLDGDHRTCGLIKSHYVEATGVQDLKFEASSIVKAVSAAIDQKQGQPDQDIDDPGFALTQGNVAQRADDMWGCVITPPQ